MNKHLDCECQCQLAEHKGYQPCEDECQVLLDAQQRNMSPQERAGWMRARDEEVD